MSRYTDIGRLVRRSSMIFPVNVPRFVEKAHTRGADCLVLDLEDSVPVSEKEAARALVKDAIASVARGGSDVSVRINKPLEMARRDLEASVWPGLACVSCPKVESATEVRLIDEVITELERARGIKHGAIQMAIAVETARGVINAYEIASTSPRVVTLGVGAEDLCREMGVEVTKEGRELLYSQSKIVIDAHAAGVQPTGLVGVDPFTWGDPEAVYQAAVQSRKMGFKGAICIHPGPIPHLNRGFSPAPEEVDYARRALGAFEEGVRKGTASVNFEGRMVDIATAERCRNILTRADAIAQLEARKAAALKTLESV
jgi:citrate lyase subunit beta/citryl-CoA lyase